MRRVIMSSVALLLATVLSFALAAPASGQVVTATTYGSACGPYGSPTPGSPPFLALDFSGHVWVGAHAPSGWWRLHAAFVSQGPSTGPTLTWAAIGFARASPIRVIGCDLHLDPIGALVFVMFNGADCALGVPPGAPASFDFSMQVVGTFSTWFPQGWEFGMSNRLDVAVR